MITPHLFPNSYETWNFHSFLYPLNFDFWGNFDRDKHYLLAIIVIFGTFYSRSKRWIFEGFFLNFLSLHFFGTIFQVTYFGKILHCVTSIIAFKTCGKFNRVATHTITFSVTNGIERFFTSDEFMLEIVIISRSLKELLMIILARRMNLFSKYEFVTLFSIICKDYFDDSHDIIAILQNQCLC